jgi:hypothetical protein
MALSQADPNWLMSTTAQCAAAIVAIVGGFLVSRVISIQSGDSTTRRRLGEAGVRHDSLVAARDLQRALLLRLDANDVLAENLRHIFSEDGQVTARDLLARTPSARWTTEQMESFLETRLQVIREAFAAFSGVPLAEFETFEWAAVRAATQLQSLSEADNALYSFVYNEFERRARHERLERESARFPYGARLDIDGPSIVESTAEVNRRDDAATALANVEREIALVESEQDYLRDSLRDLPASRDLWFGLGVLALFACSGVVLPIVMIAVVGDDGPLSFDSKVTVIAGFAVGLVALAAYLVVQILRLTRRSTESTVGGDIGR